MMFFKYGAYDLGFGLRTTYFLAAALALSAVPKLSAARENPNIVIILADDLGYGDVGSYNPESRIPTPNLDRLTQQGIRFTDAHTPSAVCTPTRYGLLTGRYCWRTNLRRSVLWPWDLPLIEKDRLTMPEMLRRQGYATACIGKWHLGWNWPLQGGGIAGESLRLTFSARDPRRLALNKRIDWNKPITGGPIDHGFDYYFGDDVPNFPPYVFLENNRTLGIPSVPKPDNMFGIPGPALPGWKLEDVMIEITRRSVRYIEERSEKDNPFFLYFPLTAPHTPIAPAEQFIGKSKAGLYGDYMHEVDWSVGEVWRALERSGQLDDTLLIFTSDNGPERFAYERIQEYGHYSMAELRGVKRDNWEGGHRVPFLAFWKGKIHAASTSNEIICLTDLMATVAAILSVELPEDAAEDSYNILPVLLGEALEDPIREATVHHSYRGRFAIRQGNWVYIDFPTGDDNQEPEWFKKERSVEEHNQPAALYDLAEDPQEKKNLIAVYPEKAKELKLLLEKYQYEGHSVPSRD